MKPLTRGQRQHLLHLLRRGILEARLQTLWANKLRRVEDGYFELRDWPATAAAGKYRQ